MSDSFYFDSLYPFQDEALTVFKTIETEFYLTGGTAASRGYLEHRFSDDLDFFVNDDPRFSLWADRIIRVRLFWNRRKALFFNRIAPVAHAEGRNRRAL